MSLKQTDVCVPNIGPAERRKRLAFGVAAFGVALILASAMVITGVSRWWRLALFIPAWMGATGVFQAREKT